jgi:DNA-directed RNA polymerase subunit L
VFFVICQKPESDSDDLKSLMTKPLVVEALTESVYSQDLVPVVLTQTHDDEDDPHYEYDKIESDKVKAVIKYIFPFNELIAEVNHNQKLNVVLNPVLGSGNTNIRWAPCTFLYRYEMDPKWRDMDHGVVERGQIRRKIEGERALKHLFVHKPPEDITQPAISDKPYNRFGLPYGHVLAFQYNGKMDEVTAFHSCICTLTSAVDHFLKRYLEANPESSDHKSSMMSKEVSEVSSDDGSLNSHMEILYIPKNTQDELPSEDHILTGVTIGNIITTKILEIIEGIVTEKGLPDTTWSQTHVAYKVPHPLIKQCLIMIKLPGTLLITHKKLITDAVQQIKEDLSSLSSAVLAAVNKVV